MTSKLRAGTPYIALALMAIAVLLIASCRTDQVEVPPLTGPSGARLFLTMDAAPDKIFIKKPNQANAISRITIQLKDQLGHPVPNETIAFRIINAEGSEVAIGTLDARTRTTDSGGFARVTYTAPSAAEQPVPTTVYVVAIMTNPAFTFEVSARQKLDLELAKPFNCVGGPGEPTLAFTVNPAAPTVNQSVCFDAQGTTDNGSIVSFSWSFGDGGTASGIVACHTFKRKGQFNVTLTVVDSDRNCVSLTRLVNVGVGGAPTCTFTTSPNPVNTDTLVNFDASASADADGTIVSFRWDFGDGHTGGGEKTTHSYNFTGSFTVTLTIRDDAGNESVCTNTVTVGTSFPVCAFTITPNPADVNEEVTLDGSSSTDPQGNVLSFSWDLNDDGQFDDDTGVIVTTSFSTKGTKIINLQVTDQEGNSSVCSHSLSVGNTPPTCDSFTSDASGTITPGTTVNFTVTASDTDGDPLSVKFTTAPSANPAQATDNTAPFNFTATFSQTSTVTAVVNDGAGGTDTCAPITITVNNPLPVCSFTAAPNSGPVPLAVTFNGSASHDTDEGNTSIVDFSWDFGDGNSDDTGAVATTAHTYTTPCPTAGCTAVLTVTDDEGASVSCQRIITASAVVPNITIDDAQVIEGNAGTASMNFAVHLDQTTSVPVTITYNTADGTATTADADYVGVTSQTLIIPANSSGGTISITVNGDINIEPNETFSVQLTNAVNGNIADNSATGTITNDD